MALVCSVAVAVTASYCLAYTHFAGDRETLAGAISWGIINVAPWVGALEIARHSRRFSQWLSAAIVALIFSLALEWAMAGNALTSFDIVRRLPGLVLFFAAIVVLEKVGRDNSSRKSGDASIELAGVEWVRGAGNYLELHKAGAQPQMVRATLSAVLREHAEDFVRVHRSYLVRRAAIAKIDSASVLLANGKRVPLGQRYRTAVLPT